jgi:membrane protease YdiL (CAAX protease family)
MKSVLDGQPIDTVVHETTEVVQAGYPPWWIAIASGLLFGLAHFDYGVSWVPLMVLGTVLARVYQLQRSILPCFIIHALFNSLAMAGFAMELFVKPSV